MTTKYIYIFLLLISCNVIVARGQVRNDTVLVTEQTGLSDEEIRELTTPLGTSIQGEITGGALTSGVGLKPLSGSDIELNPAYDAPQPQMGNLRYALYPRGSQLPQWATGYLYGYNGTYGSQLSGYVNYAGVGVSQQLGEYFIFNGGASLAKYGVYYNTVSFNGSLTWQPNRYFSTTVFGNYTRGFLAPMPMGYSVNWGGYLTLQTDTDVPFGIDAGAQDYYDPFSGHTVVPIVKPFVKLGGAKLGIDFGPVIKDALIRANGGGGSNGGFNPIPKPQKAIPAVGPRR